jgi:hypothetical protein
LKCKQTLYSSFNRNLMRQLGEALDVHASLGKNRRQWKQLIHHRVISSAQPPLGMLE